MELARPIAAVPIVIMATTLMAQGNVADDRPTIFVHIENRAAVLPEIIASAQAELAHIYDVAGVRVESSVQPDHSRCVGQLTVHVALLGGDMADRYIEKEHVRSKVLAQANGEARRVYVFWERVGPAVDHQAISRGDALGLVIAHELGHVLLPARGHSRSSIMQENYQVFFSYTLKFTADESAAMRAFIASQTEGTKDQDRRTKD